jgi:hypothetical protein
MNINEIKKDLYKSKADAVFMYYSAGNLYYSVPLADGTYKFPISTVEEIKESKVVKISIEEGNPIVDIDESTQSSNSESETESVHVSIDSEEPLALTVFTLTTSVNLSSDLSTTPFESVMKGSLLIRWIQKAVESEDFVKITI